MTQTRTPEIDRLLERMGESDVSETISHYWDGHDPWGSAMAEGFAVCEVIHFHTPGSVPEGLGYRPSIMGEEPEDPLKDDLLYSFERGDFTLADLLDYAELLDEFLDACKAAGLDY